MPKAKIDGIVLEYRVEGTGDPLLLISTGPLADSFCPFVTDDALRRRHRMITYHQRGQVGTARGPGLAPIPFEQHAADAAGLLRHLDIPRAHVAGHSTGAAIALQLAIDRPDLVQSLVLLEPPLMSVRSAGAFLDQCGPAIAAYESGDREGAMTKFLAMVSGLGWDRCREVLEANVPGGVAQAVADADSFFAGYLAALGAWRFGESQAAAIRVPILSVLGADTEQLFVDSHEQLHAWFPDLDDCRVDGVGHLLHMQQAEGVRTGVADWLARHPLPGVRPTTQHAVS